VKVMVLNPPSKVTKNVVRDLFYGCWCKGKRIASAKFPPSTLIYVVAVLKKEGHDVTLLDSQALDMDLDEVKKEVEHERPRVIIIPTSTMSFIEDVHTLKELKKLSDCKTMAFGSQVTFFPDSSLKEEGLDYAVMREPEYIIRDFINRLERGKGYERVKGLAFRKGEKVIVNPPYPFIENLDDLPFPDRQCIINFSYFNPLVKKLPWTTAITSRGCPGRCNFCTSPAFYGKTLRARSPENVADEMEEIARLGYKEIFFRDETFTANPERVRKICRLIKERGIEILWICSARIGTVDKELMKTMKDAGCHMLRFGVESGVQKILDNINKGIKAEMTRKTFKWANEIGMETHAHVMLGCVGETHETVEKTIQFVKDIRPTTVTFGAYTPYPGTEIFEYVKKRAPEIGSGSSHDLSKLHSVGFYNHLFCDLSDEEVGKLVKKAYKKFYMRPSYILSRLWKIRSRDEFRMVISAGIEVTSFSLGSE